MRTARVLVAISIVLVMLPSLALAGSASRTMGPTDKEEECLEPTPAEYSVPTDPQDEVSLEVLVLLDGPTLEQGQKVMARAADAYKPLGIELRPRYESVDFEPDRTEDTDEISHYRRLVQDARYHTAGERPPDSDLVYVLTSKTIDGAAGFADCIGGVRYPNRAYAVGEFHEQEVLSFGLNFYVDRNAETLAHELGHLMGAHHHYANCAQGVGADDVTNREPAACTLMFNFLDFTSINFSTINAATVKGHALAYASNTPTADKVFDRIVSISLTGHLRAKGKISAKGPRACVAGVEVEIVKAGANGQWTRGATAITNRSGAYRADLDDASGSYRARVFVSELNDGQDGYCRQFVTEPVAHSH